MDWFAPGITRLVYLDLGALDNSGDEPGLQFPYPQTESHELKSAPHPGPRLHPTLADVGSSKA